MTEAGGLPRRLYQLPVADDIGDRLVARASPTALGRRVLAVLTDAARFLVPELSR